MNDLVNFENGQLRTTSKIISDVFGKAHRKILRDIASLDCSPEFSTANFGRSEYQTDRGKTYQCYNITRDGFSFLCMGFTGKKAAKWKEAYILAFNQMEKGLLNADQRISTLSIKGKEIKQAGSEWSALGREINKQKKAHNKDMVELMSDVQLTLGFDA